MIVQCTGCRRYAAANFEAHLTDGKWRCHHCTPWVDPTDDVNEKALERAYSAFCAARGTEPTQEERDAFKASTRPLVRSRG